MWDALYDGRRFRLLTSADNHTRESLAVRVGQRLRGHAVAAGVVDTAAWWPRLSPGAWRERLTQPQDGTEVLRLRLWTGRGRPLGGDTFVAKVEKLFRRRLRPLAPDHPRKAKSDE